MRCVLLFSAIILSLPCWAAEQNQKRPCVELESNKIITLTGFIVGYREGESEGQPPHDTMAIILDHPICSSDGNEQSRSVEVTTVNKSFLGHRAAIEAQIIAGDAPYAKVKSIKPDVSTSWTLP